MSKTIKEFLSIIGAARRAEDYERMNEAVGGLNEKLGGDESLDASAAHSKMTYELHMAAFQQAQALLQKSMELANQSVREAKKVGDVAGELLPMMNVGGHLLPALGECNKGIAVLQKTIKKVEEAMPEASSEDAYRLSFVMMTCYLLLVEIAIAHDEDPAYVARWQSAAEATDVFAKEYKDSDWGRERVRKAQTFIKSKKS